MSITDPRLWFRGKAVENARKRIKAANWELFTAKPHDPSLYPETPSATHCGWHGKACGAGPVWAVMVPLKSANRLSTCSLGTLEIVAHYRSRAQRDDIELTFEGALPDEASVKLANLIVDLYINHHWTWVAISALVGIEQQRTRRLFDYVEGRNAHKNPRRAPKATDQAA